MKYEVWMGFKNYLGEVYDLTKIATFISRARAEHYVAICEAESEDDVEYKIIER